MKRGRAENLRVFSPAEARENGRKGGIRSGEARREKRRLRELLEMALSRVGEDGTSTAEAVTAAIIDRALTGDVRAYEVIRDTLGEKPTEQVAQDTRVEITWNA